MNVQRVSNNGISGNFYIFNNSNYRQIDKTAVTPVKPVKKLPGFTGRGDNQELAAVYKQEKMPEALGTKQIDSIKVDMHILIKQVMIWIICMNARGWHQKVQCF